MDDLRDEARDEKQTRQDMALFLGHKPGDTYFPKGKRGQPRAVTIGEALRVAGLRISQIRR